VASGADSHADNASDEGGRYESSAAEPRVDRPLRVLLAEDNAVNTLYMTRLLRKEGHTVTTVDNGRDAIRLVQEGTYDLVLMDIQMPALDGVAATRQIRQFSTVPIVALTAYAQQSELERFLNAGMDATITKPVDEYELRRVVAEEACGPPR
jgi:CheY-like chemotaxis protein